MNNEELLAMAILVRNRFHLFLASDGILNQEYDLLFQTIAELDKMLEAAGFTSPVSFEERTAL